MTNAQIIFGKSQELAKAGLLAYTGRVLHGIDASGAEITIRETEEIHTFAEWKRRGFSVKKGSRAVAAFPIWKFTSKTVETEDGEQETKNSMFLKLSHFFSASQVQEITK